MCFVAGCGVATPGGVRPVETIVQGDLVLTHDGRAEPVIWVGLTRVTWAEQMGNARRRPVRIGKDALGPGVPERAVMVSPQHRVLVRSPLVARAARGGEALVPALSLTALPAVRQMPSLPGLDYVHIACARHVLLLAEGVAVETALPEPLALQEMNAAQREALVAAVGQAEPGWPVLSMRKAERVVARSMARGAPLVVAERGTDLRHKASG
ncbi:Hint domain-containing protein [Sagittula sp.]|uniref:Hint domain-containing protein n=1 Tax=Sagittula sp. TaxID=2038081 RepID=UPI00351704C4